VCALRTAAKNNDVKKSIAFIFSFCLMVFMCSVFMVLMFVMGFFCMILRFVMCFMFQRVMVMTEDRLETILSVQPSYKSLIKIDNIHSESYHIKGIFHVDFRVKFI